MAKVLNDYAKGSEPLATVAKRHGTSDDTIRRWALEDAEAYGLYTRARNISAGALEDEALTVARRSTAESYGADRVLIDTLKWAAAKRYPKGYGDKVDITTDGQSMVSGVIVMPAPLPVGAPGIAATARIAPQATVTRQLGASNAEGYAAQEDSPDDAPHNAT